MSIIPSIIAKTITSITSQDIQGATAVRTYGFEDYSNLKHIELPSTVTSIEDNAFDGCFSLQNVTFPPSLVNIGMRAFNRCKSLTSVVLPASVKKVGVQAWYSYDSETGSSEPLNITTVDLSQLPEDCNIDDEALIGTKWYNNQPNNTFLLAGDGTILMKFKGDTLPGDIPNTVRTISAGAMGSLKSPTTLVIPDTVRRLYGDPVSSANNVVTMIIGAGVHTMKAGSMGSTKVTTWICRQPANMVLDIPTEAGDGKGLAYNKSSRSFTLYTDNEMLKAYNWSGDNVTATIKPLSEAPAT